MKVIILPISLIISLLFFLSTPAISQAVPAFEEVIYNFGKIQEDKGAQGHTFIFLNKGPANLSIDTVETECGCTSSFWTREAIAKDSSGQISISFNPGGLGGDFQKEILVKFRDISNPTKLRIVGTVIPGLSDPKAYYKTKIGGTRFESNYLNIGKITLDTFITKSFDIYNDSDTVITFLDQIGYASHMEVQLEPQAIIAGETGKITVTFDARKLKSLGPRSDLITLTTDENNRNAIKYLHVSSEVKYPMPKLTEEELKNAPNIKFEKWTHNFGDLIEGEIVEVKFPFTNIGKSDLKIIQTSASCGCTAGVADKEIYSPGERGVINVTFNSRRRPGNQSKHITVYTNSPTNPEMDLRISAIVKTDIPESE